jgi:hypothetical protein
MTITNKQAPSQQQQQASSPQQSLTQALGLNMRLPRTQNPFSFPQMSNNEQRAQLLKTIDQALELTAGWDDDFFSEEENLSSSLFGNTSHDKHDDDDRNSLKQ